MGESYSVRCEVPWIGWLESADRAQNRQTRALCLGEALCPETSRPAFAELEEYVRTNAQQSLPTSRTRSSRIYVRINTASLSGNGPRDFCYRSITHFSPLWCPTGFSNLENRNVAPTIFTPLKRTSILYIYLKRITELEIFAPVHPSDLETLKTLNIKNLIDREI